MNSSAPQTNYQEAGKNAPPNPCASNSLTSSKKKMLKVMVELPESIVPTASLRPSTSHSGGNDPAETYVDSYEARRNSNKCPYTNIEVVEGTLQSSRQNHDTPFVKWTIRVTFTDNRVHYCYKRYSEFVSLRNKVANGLQRMNKSGTLQVPELPSALPWYKALTLHDYYANNTLDSEFLANRQRGLEYFLCYLMLDENLCELFDASVFKHWLNIQHKDVVVSGRSES